DIAKVSGREIIWQNGVLLRPSRQDSEALVRADYHTRTIDILVKGTDATLYLGMLRDSILATLETMPQLRLDILRNYPNGAEKQTCVHPRARRHVRDGSCAGGDAGTVRFEASRCLSILFEQGWRADPRPCGRTRRQAHPRLVRPGADRRPALSRCLAPAHRDCEGRRGVLDRKLDLVEM